MHVARLMPKKTPATCVVLVLARLPGPGVSAVLRASAGPHTRNSPVHAIPGLQVLRFPPAAVDAELPGATASQPLPCAVAVLRSF